MELQKQTIILSRLDKIAGQLKDKNLNPHIAVLNKIKGKGNNDFIKSINSYRIYDIRRLDYLDFVILEQFVEVKDKELDDFIISKKFDKDEVPKNWKTHVIK